MPRRPRLSLENQLRLGRAVLRGRAENIPWKILSREYGFGKKRLWEFTKLVTECDGESVSKHLISGQPEELADKVVPLQRRAVS